MSSNNFTLSKQEALDYHTKDKPGKLSIIATKSLITQRDLSLAYSPGVAEPCLEIKENPQNAYLYTIKGNLVAVISNGTAVLGLGNLGALASKPVMEGKAVLFKKFADIDSIDIEVGTENIAEFINTVKNIAPTFGGINLEDIKSPECFEIEETLSEMLDIPVFHDDQHGTAIIACAGLINAADITGRKLEDMKVVVNGCGAAGISCIELMKTIGILNIIACDKEGVIHSDREFDQNDRKKKYAVKTSARNLKDALKGADVFIGLSVADALPAEYLTEMNDNPIIFALANPNPEIKPELARKVRPNAIIATGRSDYNNQINNVMCFPYLFRGALDVQARKFNTEMKLAAVHAISAIAREPIPDEVISAYAGKSMTYGKEYILPKPFDPRLITRIAPAVAKVAIDTGVARKKIDIEEYKNSLFKMLSPVSNTFNIISNSIKNSKKRIIFSEGEEEKIIKVAVQWRDMNYGIPILVGRQNIIDERMSELGISDKSGIEIINAAISKRNDIYIDHLYQKLQRKGYLYRTCVRAVKTDRNAFASCMLACGDGDAMIAGLTRSYGASLNEILPIIGDDGIVFGISIVIIDGKTLFIADTAINNTPDAKQLARIAIKTSEIVKYMGYIPRVALIAHSNFGSFNNESAVKCREAIEILDKLKLDFEYDGEMAIDTAINSESIKTYPFCRLTDTANILVMPNIESASAACKLVQEVSGANVIGPILTGTKKSVQIVHISSSISDILNLSIIAAKSSD
jgi:malate dehydrogenase (oxaloacetate-decarboxylating)(NADP+)